MADAPFQGPSVDQLQASVLALSSGSVALSSATPLYNVKQWGFGAKLTTGILLSAIYSTLAAAQVVYPHATALTNTVDWAAVQGAINAAKAAGGGIVYVPGSANKYVCDQPIVIPEAFTSSTGFTGAEVSILGDGKNSTSFQANADFGAGSALMSCGVVTATPANALGRYGGNTTYVGFCEGFSLLSTYTKIVKGQPPMLPNTTTIIRMSGIAHGARRQLRNLYIANFYAGWDLVGDHTNHRDVICENNFYGLYFNNANTTLYGDNRFDKCSFTGAMAGVAIHPNAGCTGEFNSCYFGSQPYGILKEAGTQSAAGGFLSACIFNRCQFENLGNGMLKDMNVYKNGKVARVVETSFNQPYFSWSSSNRVTSVYDPTNTGTALSVGYEAVVDIYSLDGAQFLNVSTAGNWTPGTTAVFNLNTLASSATPGALFEGMLDNMLSSCTVATPFLLGPAFPSSSMFQLRNAGSWEGRCHDTIGPSGYFSQNAVKGDIAESFNGQITIGGAGGTSPMSTTDLSGKFEGIFAAPCGPGVPAVIVTKSPFYPVNTGAATATKTGSLRKGYVLGTITAGGSPTGYANGDVVTLTATTGVILRAPTVVATVSGSTTTWAVQDSGSFSAFPTTAFTQASTTGSGSGVTFTGTCLYGKAVTDENYSNGAAPIVGISRQQAGGSAGALTMYCEIGGSVTARSHQLMAAAAFTDVYFENSGSPQSPGSSFTRLSLPSVNSDVSGNWNATNNWYVCPCDGVYEITGQVRVADSTAAGKQYGVGVYTTEQDGPHFLWTASGAATRSAYPYARRSKQKRGDLLRMFSFTDSGVNIIRATLQISLVAPS